MLNPLFAWMWPQSSNGREDLRTQAEREQQDREGDDSDEYVSHDVPFHDEEVIIPTPFGNGWRMRRAPRLEEPEVPTYWDGHKTEQDLESWCHAVFDALASRHLPFEIEHLIMEQLQLSDTLRLSVTRDDAITYSSNANMRHVRTPIMRLKPVEMLIEIESHDQGWSSEPTERHGTYEASYTWWDLTLERPKDDMSSEDRAKAASVNEDDPFGEVLRVELQRNVHASSDFRLHTIRLKQDHELLRAFRPGDTVCLWARTLYPGWANSVRMARISVWMDYDM